MGAVMSSLRAIGFLDVSTFTARFITTYRERLKDDANYPGAQTIMLRSASSDAAILKEWKSGRAVLQHLRNAAAPFLGGKPAVLGKCMVVSLKPGSHTDWQRSDDEYTQEHFRLHIGMVPSPLAMVYSGGEGLNIMVGQVVAVDQQQLHSEINIGSVARVNLVCDVRRPAIQED